jgi:hypothetical protein
LNKSLCGVFVQSQANGEWLVAILGLKLVEVGFQVELVEKERKKNITDIFSADFGTKGEDTIIPSSSRTNVLKTEREMNIIITF